MGSGERDPRHTMPFSSHLLKVTHYEQFSLLMLTLNTSHSHGSQSHGPWWSAFSTYFLLLCLINIFFKAPQAILMCATGENSVTVILKITNLTVFLGHV